MYKLYLGDPMNGGTLIGIYHSAKLAAKAMEESAACHRPGAVYYMILDKDESPSVEKQED